jgi:hypothetical protein
MSYTAVGKLCALFRTHWFLTRVTWRVPLGTTYRSRAPDFTPGIKWGLCYYIFSCICMFCRSLFVLLSFFILQLCCLSFDLRILITFLESSWVPLVYFYSIVSRHLQYFMTIFCSCIYNIPFILGRPVGWRLQQIWGYNIQFYRI